MSCVQFLSRFGRGATSVLLSLVLINGSRAADRKVQTKRPSAVFHLLYTFTGGADGYNPQAGVVFDEHGALYGTTFFGGTAGFGTVFRLAPTGHGSWTLDTIHSFAGYPNDVSNSYAHVTFDQEGNLYGTAGTGGRNLCFIDSCGGIFKLSAANGGWKESVIYNFTKNSGETPAADLTFYKDVFYGSTWFGPEKKNEVGYGTLFSLTRGKNDVWKHQMIHAFDLYKDGYEPSVDLLLDNRKCCPGNIYGSTPYGGTSGNGNVFKLIPGSGGSWGEKLLYPSGSSALTMDSHGNLYGTTGGGSDKCVGGCGTVFELQFVPKQGWRKITLYEFGGGSDGESPDSAVVFDTKGNLYGTTLLGGTGTCHFYQFSGCGTVFKLSPRGDGTWQKTTLHNFTGRDDGEFPTGGTLIFDHAGCLYGTTLGGATYGSSGYGTVYRITPPHS